MISTRDHTGQKPRKTTPRRFILVDRIADWAIRSGGLLVIVAAAGILAFLVVQVVPLFTGAIVESESRAALTDAGPAALDRLDEHRTVLVSVFPDGRIRAVHIPTGKDIPVARADFGGEVATAVGRTPNGAGLVFGFADGSLRFARLDIRADLIEAGSVPATARTEGSVRIDESAVYAPMADGHARRTRVALSVEPSRTAGDKAAAIAMLDYRVGGTAERQTRTIASIDADGAVRIGLAESRVNLLTRQMRTTITPVDLPPLPQGFVPVRLVVTERGDQLLVAGADGRVVRYDARDPAKPVIAEVADIGQGAALTVFGFLIGEQTLIVGRSDGGVSGYFVLPREGASTADGRVLVEAHRFEPQGGAVVALAVGERSKMFATADRSGGVWLRHATSERVLMRLLHDGGPAGGLAIAPRDDGIVAVSNSEARLWHVDVPHSETTVRAIFGQIWYEGYPGPSYTWQSSSGTDQFEPKFSLVPLIFGTIKATLYALLFSVPVALLAAVYTSEFLHRHVRAAIKPTVEMMASLPSVVLGFIAALILAPAVEAWIAAVILAFVMLPLSLLAGAHLWQLLPPETARANDGIAKFGLMILALSLGILASAYLAGPFEALVFAGDLKAWAAGGTDDATPFMTLLLWPAAFFATALGFEMLGGPRLAARRRALSAQSAAVEAGAVWLGTVAVSLALAALVAAGLSWLGADPRGGVVDTYVQRNTLVVGFVMGFAVIPIVYTIADDALGSVPEHLRAASLACGATPWQTAIRIVVPTAMSGIFAAVMVGMGRAVGETMIVVMAAGNTPILDWNVFNGLRALSANIAVELPEAVRDSTLYRMLFLAALTLFAMTFVINTAAELVRLHFRKRAAQL